MTIKDMARLRPETVKLWNGKKWTQLLGVSKSQRKGDEIEIVLRSGERISCTSTHEWPTKNGIKQTSELAIGDIIEHCDLPTPEICICPDKLSTIGRFIGLYLAEGSRDTSLTIQIAGHKKEKERFVYLKSIASSFGGTCRKHNTSENGMMICMDGKILNAIIDTYIAGRIAKDKHFTTAFWQQNDKFLFDVLYGYLEGDGSWDLENNRWRIGFTRNYNLESDLRTLCARLGYQIKIKLSKSYIGKKEYKSFRGEFRPIPSSHGNAKDRGEIIEIRKSRTTSFYDIGVEDEPYLFALASGILTHNSKPNPMPSSAKDRFTVAHEQIWFMTKSNKPTHWQHRDGKVVWKKPKPDYIWIHKDTNEEHPFPPSAEDKENWKRINLWSGCDYYWDQDAVREPNHPDGRKVTTMTDVKRQGTVLAWNRKTGERWPHPSGHNKRDVWTIPTQAFSDAHFAVFPEKLIEPCILAGSSHKACPHCRAPWRRVVEKKSFKTLGFLPTCNCENNDGSGGCIVLDPFFGSGTVGVVCKYHDRNCKGIEPSKKYVDMSIKRIVKGTKKLKERKDSAQNYIDYWFDNC